MTPAPGGDGSAGRSDAALLSLIWLASPALPVGGFSYSDGLEAACEALLVTGEAEAARWLADQLDLALARAELPAMLRAFDAWRRHDLDAVALINDWVRRSRESAEALRQVEQTGRSLAEWLRNGGTRSGEAAAADAVDPRIEALAALAPAPTWPVAFALAAAQTPAGARDAALAMAFGWAENMAQAAMKAVPLGQGAAQRLLGRLAAALPATVDAACAIAAGPAPADGDLPVDDDAAACRDLQAYAPMWAILSAQHEVQYSRLFRS